MSYFNWDAKRFNLDIKEMDREHQKIVSIMNELFEANAKGEPKAMLMRLLNDLVTVTTTHFSDEERFMASFGYEGLESHKQIHKNLLNELTIHLGRYRAGGDRVPDEIFTFLRFWLSAHITGIDKQYAKVAKSSA